MTPNKIDLTNLLLTFRDIFLKLFLTASSLEALSAVVAAEVRAFLASLDDGGPPDEVFEDDSSLLDALFLPLLVSVESSSWSRALTP